jgi:cell wall assembly regulator SMI1
MEAELENLWSQIDHSPIADGVRGVHLFNPGARPGELADFNKQYGGLLPIDLLDSLARHNGTRDGMNYYCFYDGNFLSISASCSEAARRLDVLTDFTHEPENIVGSVKPLFWNPLWVPVLKKNKEPVCVDLCPAADGVIGQIIEVDWEDSSVKVIANSYCSFLRLVVASL